MKYYRIKEINPVYDEFMGGVGKGWIFCTNPMPFLDTISILISIRRWDRIYKNFKHEIIFVGEE